MILIKSPFDEVAFSKETKILLDACILLALLDKRDRMCDKCIKAIKPLQEKDAKFFVSNVVIAEVINKTISKLFINDLQFLFNGLEPINSEDNINNIFDKVLEEKDANILLNEHSLLNDILGVRYNKYFNKINKSNNKEIRRLLYSYFDKANSLCKDLEKEYDIRFLPVNENIMNYARELMTTYMLGINDSQHLSTAKTHRMDYILSTDGDFGFVEDELKVKFLKIS